MRKLKEFYNRDDFELNGYSTEDPDLDMSMEESFLEQDLDLKEAEELEQEYDQIIQENEDEEYENSWDDMDD